MNIRYCEYGVTIHHCVTMTVTCYRFQFTQSGMITVFLIYLCVVFSILTELSKSKIFYLEIFLVYESSSCIDVNSICVKTILKFLSNRCLLFLRRRRMPTAFSKKSSVHSLFGSNANHSYQK